MHYFIDAAGNVFAFVSATQAPEGLSPISESDALALAAAPSPEVDYPAVIAAERYRRERVGVSLNGFVIDTSREGQALIAGAAVSAIIDPTYTCNWKTGNGFIALNASELLGLATAVRTHVQACFDRELALLRAVESGEYRDPMLLEGWPEPAPVSAANAGLPSAPQ